MRRIIQIWDEAEGEMEGFRAVCKCGHVLESSELFMGYELSEDDDLIEVVCLTCHFRNVTEGVFDEH